MPEMCELGNPSHTNISVMTDASDKMCMRSMSRETQPMPNVYYDGNISKICLRCVNQKTQLMLDVSRAGCPLRWIYWTKYA